jgi:murein DD-endopeptidase MepM/ murein hydrolase activator NlpD
MALLGYPLAVPRKTQSFSSSHQAVDYGASVGTPLHAAADGVVKRSYTSTGHLTEEEGPPWSYGERIIIDHANGFQTTYNHASNRFVQAGDVVARGQTIGLSGNTGYSKGPHLHFEVLHGGTFVNPEDYLGDDPPVDGTNESPGESGSALANKGMLIAGIGALAIAAITLFLVLKG